jgi:hypothetical protein
VRGWLAAPAFVAAIAALALLAWDVALIRQAFAPRPVSFVNLDRP